MYNLLISGDPEAWDQEFYELDISRFLEYTNKNIVARFGNAIEENGNALLEIPCLFMYESSINKDAQVGFLRAVKKRGKKIFIEFEFLDIEIPSTALEQNALLFDIRDWESNRTHWAIKDENLAERLLQLGIISESEIPSLIKSNVNQPYMSKSRRRDSTITSVNGYIGKVFKTINEYNDVEWFFRGHSHKEKYRLEPSLLRKDISGNYLYKENEHNMFREMLLHNPADFETDKSTIEKLVRMQHYSLPTRLLDITSNPLIALYFACKSAENNKYDGEILCFSIKRSSIEYYDSEAVSAIANLALLSFIEKEELSHHFANIDKNKGITPINKLKQYIQDEKPYFNGNLSEAELSKVICVKCKENNERIVSQSGSFLLFGLDSVLNEEGSTDIRIVRITVQEKEKILNELDKLNINERTIFPFIENTAKYVAEKWLRARII